MKRQPEPDQGARLFPTGANPTALAFLLQKPADPGAAGQTVAALLELIDTRDQALQALHGVTFNFSAYCTGGRRPESAPAVRQYLLAVHQQWCWWSHFLAPDPDEWATVLLGLAPMTRDAGGRWVTSVPHLRALGAQTLRAGRALHAHLGIASSDSRRILAVSHAAMRSALPKLLRAQGARP